MITNQINLISVKNNYYKKYSKLVEPNNERSEQQGYPIDQEGFAISYLGLRKTIGLLGFALPLLCIFGSLMHDYRILPSISHYYHSSMRICFASILVLLAFFLWHNSVGDIYERGVCKILSVMSVLIVLFPTKNSICIIKACYTNNDLKSFVSPTVLEQTWVGIIHLVSAFIFFSLLIYLIFFKFLPQEIKQDPSDSTAILIYKFCGWGMVVSILGIVITTIFFENSESWALPPTFACEAVALFCFGFAWLTKGETFSKK